MKHLVVGAFAYEGAFSCAVTVAGEGVVAGDPRHECLGYAKERAAVIGGTNFSVAQAFMPGTANGPHPINGYRPRTSGGAR